MIDCKRYPGPEDGAVQPLDRRRVACTGNGSLIFAAGGVELAAYALEGNDSDQRLRRQFAVEAPGTIAEVTCSGQDPLVTVAEEGAAKINRLQGRALVPLAELPAMPRQVLAAPGGVFVLMAAGPGRPPEVLRLDARTGAVEASVRVPAGIATLRPAKGRAVIAVDPRRRRVRRIDLDEVCERPGSAEPDPSDPPQKGKCRCCVVPCCCAPRDPENGRPEPSRPPPRDFCDDGSDAIDDDCFVYTAAGFSIVQRDVCRPEREPCRRTLHSRVERMELLGDTLFAITRSGRTVEAVDPRSLAVRSQSALAGAGSLILAAPAAGQLLSIAPDLSQVVVVQSAPPGTQAALGVEAEISERVVLGTDLAGGPNGPLFALEDRSVLIVPIVDPTENYSGPSNATYKLALENSTEAPLPKVLFYYDEQSNSQQVLTFTMFGAETPDFYSGGPIEIEKKLTLYFYPDFEPGGMETVTSLGPSVASFRMRGNATRKITATSSVNATNENDANEFEFELDFPAAIVRIDLDSGKTLSITPSGPDWPISYEDSSGNSRSLTLEPSNLSQPVVREFNAAGGTFDAETEDLREALATMLAASSSASDFDAIDVVWGKGPGEALGRLYILFRFAGGGKVPRITNVSVSSTIANFFDVDSNDIDVFRGWADFDLSPTASDLADEEKAASRYLTIVMRLAEIAAADERDERNVRDPVLGSAKVEVGGGFGDVGSLRGFGCRTSTAAASARSSRAAGRGTIR